MENTNNNITEAIVNTFAVLLMSNGTHPYCKNFNHCKDLVEDFVKQFDTNADHACLTVYDDFGNECEYWGLQDYFFYFTTEFDEHFGTHTGYLDLTDWLYTFGFERFEDRYFDYRVSGEWEA